MLDVANLTVRYGRRPAVRGMSITVAAGQVVALVGANGAGKSSLLKAVHGLLDDVDGDVRVGDAAIGAMPTGHRVDAGLALVPEGRHVFATMSVDENLDLGARAVDEETRERRRAGVFERFPRLRERRRQKAGTLSGGEQQMLAIGRALMSGPSVLMLDEPTLGLAPKVIGQVGELLRQLGAEGMAVLLAEQNVRMALAVADHGYVIRNGQVVHEGSARDLSESETVRQAYLGAG